MRRLYVVAIPQRRGQQADYESFLQTKPEETPAEPMALTSTDSPVLGPESQVFAEIDARLAMLETNTDSLESPTNLNSIYELLSLALLNRSLLVGNLQCCRPPVLKDPLVQHLYLEIDTPGVTRRNSAKLRGTCDRWANSGGKNAVVELAASSGRLERSGRVFRCTASNTSPTVSQTAAAEATDSTEQLRYRQYSIATGGPPIVKLYYTFAKPEKNSSRSSAVQTKTETSASSPNGAYNRAKLLPVSRRIKQEHYSRRWPSHTEETSRGILPPNSRPAKRTKMTSGVAVAAGLSLLFVATCAIVSRQPATTPTDTGERQSNPSQLAHCATINRWDSETSVCQQSSTLFATRRRTACASSQR